MTVDIGTETHGHVEWTSRDVMLYALGVGAGQDDACGELELTTENTAGVALQVLPSFALTLVQRAGIRPPLGDIDPVTVVHAGQSLRLHASLPTHGQAEVRSHIAAIDTKRSGTLVQIDSTLRLAGHDGLLAEARSTLFARDPARKSGQAPATPVDEEVWRERILAPTRPDQALLYRLCGDDNPLHSDPAVARAAGFERPILHGLCSLGIALRCVTARFHIDLLEVESLDVRFSAPMQPGETLSIEARPIAAGIEFQAAACDDRRKVLAGGRIGLRSRGPI